MKWSFFRLYILLLLLAAANLFAAEEVVFDGKSFNPPISLSYKDKELVIGNLLNPQGASQADYYDGTLDGTQIVLKVKSRDQLLDESEIPSLTILNTTNPEVAITLLGFFTTKQGKKALILEKLPQLNYAETDNLEEKFENDFWALIHGLNIIHNAGILQTNIHPQNLLRSKSGFPKFSNFDYSLGNSFYSQFNDINRENFNKYSESTDLSTILFNYKEFTTKLDLMALGRSLIAIKFSGIIQKDATLLIEQLKIRQNENPFLTKLILNRSHEGWYSKAVKGVDLKAYKENWVATQILNKYDELPHSENVVTDVLAAQLKVFNNKSPINEFLKFFRGELLNVFKTTQAQTQNFVLFDVALGKYATTQELLLARNEHNKNVKIYLNLEKACAETNGFWVAPDDANPQQRICKISGDNPQCPAGWNSCGNWTITKENYCYPMNGIFQSGRSKHHDKFCPINPESEIFHATAGCLIKCECKPTVVEIGCVPAYIPQGDEGNPLCKLTADKIKGCG